MSDKDLFNDDQTKVVTDTSTTTTVADDLVASLVGDGKKYKDLNALAKSKLDGDSFIARLEKENEELRKVADKNLTLETILEHIKKPTKVDETTSTPTRQPSGDTSAADVDARILKVMEDKRASELAAANLSRVHDVLVGKLGTKEAATKAIADKAKALGTSPAKLRSLATESPDAFFKLMDIKPTAGSGTSVEGTVNADALAPVDDGDRTYAWYEKLRKSNPKVYMTPKIQNQMHKDAERMGQDKFMGRTR